MCVDVVYGVGGEGGIGESGRHRTVGTLAVGRGSSDVIGIGRHPIPYHFPVYTCPPPPRPLCLLKQEDTGAFSNDEAVPVRIEGPGG
jgi:hypothetical protein